VSQGASKVSDLTAGTPRRVGAIRVSSSRPLLGQPASEPWRRCAAGATGRRTCRARGLPRRVRDVPTLGGVVCFAGAVLASGWFAARHRARAGGAGVQRESGRCCRPLPPRSSLLHARSGPCGAAAAPGGNIRQPTWCRRGRSRSPVAAVLRGLPAPSILLPSSLIFAVKRCAKDRPRQSANHRRQYSS
jgi:hypothetical protein